MSTDPTNDVGWTVPDDLEWGGDAHDGQDGESTGDDDASAREPATTRPEPPQDGRTAVAARCDTSSDRTPPGRRQSYVADLDLGSSTNETPESSDDGSAEAADGATAKTDGGPTTTVADASGRTIGSTDGTIASTTASTPAPDATDATDATGSFADRHPDDLPPRPVLAAHVDLLREERDAKETHLDAVRDRYERELRARNEEIARLRRRQGASFLERCWMRLEDLF